MVGIAAAALTSIGGPAVGGIGLATAQARPVDCAPVGMTLIDGQPYYVENCFGYDVYRPAW